MTSSTCGEESFLNDEDGISFLDETVRMVGADSAGDGILHEASIPVVATSPKSARTGSQSAAVGSVHGPTASFLSSTTMHPQSNSATTAVVAATAAPPPPATRNSRRFMNPLAERAALEERNNRLQHRKRHVAVPRQPVPMQLPQSAQEEVKAMGLILYARYARLLGSPHEAALASAAAGSLARGNVRSQEILSEAALQWVLASARPPSHEHHSKQPPQHSITGKGKGVSTSWDQPPLPVVVKPRIRLSNEDARVLFRSGATRSGQYGVYYWQFEEENHEGVLPLTAEPAGGAGNVTRRDPLLDYILVDDAEEHKQDDGGLMIPHDLKYLVEDEDDDADEAAGKECKGFSLPPHPADGDDGLSTAQMIDDVGAHRIHGKRNLLTLSLLRMWQHHEGKAARAVAATAQTTTNASLRSTKSGGTTSNSSFKRGGAGRQTSSSSVVERRSLEVQIDSPRSAYVLLKNGQKASELAVSTDPLLEERCQQRIQHLQEEYQALCCQISQRDMRLLLTSAIRSSKQQQASSSSRPQTSPGVSPQRGTATDHGRDGRSSINTTLSDESSVVAAAGESPTSRPVSRLSKAGSQRGSVPRAAQQRGATPAALQNGDGNNDGSGMHREDVLDALEQRLRHVADAKEALRCRSVERHQQRLASIWGKELQSFTAHHEKAHKVEAAVATRKRLTQLRAAGLLKEDRHHDNTSRRTMTPQRDRSVLLRSANRSPNEKRAATSMGVVVDCPELQRQLSSPATDTLVTPRNMQLQASSASFQQSPTSEFSPPPLSGSESATVARHGGRLEASGSLRTGSRTPLEIARAQYQQKEAERIKLLEEALEAKALAAKQCQERKHNALDVRRRAQLARMREVHAKSDRVKRAYEFQNALMLFHQDQQEAKLDAFHERKEELNRALQDVQHIAGVEEKMRRERFQETQRALVQTMFYEAQRRVASEAMHASFTSAAAEPPLPTIASRQRGVDDESATSPGASRRTPEAVSTNNTTAFAVQISGSGPTPIIPSRRKQWDPVVAANSKTKLVALLHKSAQQ